MRFNRLIAAGAALVGSLIGLIMTADRTKEEIRNLQDRRKEETAKWGGSQASRFQAGLEAWKNAEGAVLLDVREQEDYEKGHIPGSIHQDLQTLASTIETIVPDKTRPVFVYCYRGSRSRQAESILREAGYENVTDIGGIEWQKA